MTPEVPNARTRTSVPTFIRESPPPSIFAAAEPYLRYCNTVCGQCSDILMGKLQCLQNNVAMAIAFQRYDGANHQNNLNDFEWLNLRHLTDYDSGVLMYKTVNGHGPEICKESFHNISSTQGHGHATRSATKGDLFVPRKTTSVAQHRPASSLKAMEHDTLYNEECIVN